MKYARILLILLAAAAAAQAQPRFPLLPQKPPSVAEPTKLTGELLYVIDADAPHLVLSSPKHLLNVTEDVGPIRIRGKFIDGNGKVETREFKGKQVWIIDAVGTGKAELLVIPVGAVKASDVIRKPLDVYADIAPIPPPDPPEPPKPDPKPPTPAPIPLPGFRVLFVEETAERGKLTQGQSRILFGKPSRDWLDANCVDEDGQPGYRIYDKDASTKGDAKHWQDAMKRRPANFSVPWVIISNGMTGFEGPLPEREEDCKALLNKYLGK